MTDAAGPARTVPELVRRAEERFGDGLAVVTPDGERLTYAELVAEARELGAALVADGIGAGDRVAIWAPNGRRWIVALLGLLEAGATLVPVNTRFKGDEAAAILARAHVRALVTVTDFLGNDHVAMLRGSDVELPDLSTVVVAAGPVPDGAVGWEQLLERVDETARAVLRRGADAVAPDDVADILFTSGTTGVPKGVVQTHERTLTVAQDWVAMTGLRAGDRYLMVNPYFHMFGLKAGILASVAAGATMLPEPVFDPDVVLRRVAAEQVTVLPGPPTLYQSLLDHDRRPDVDLSSLRVAVTGAADIPVDLIRRIRDELPFSLIVTGYGLTEGGTAAATGPEDDPPTIAQTVGRPRPGFSIRIVGDTGAAVEPGGVGEIQLQGRSVMSHYLDDPDATAAAMTGDGWLRTGDLGTIDGAGNLRIVGRSKDMFIVGGFNVYPAEVEDALCRHPGIAHAAVVGVPDERLGEVGAAFVVASGGADVDPDEVIAWAREHMANFKAPRVVVVIDELPINATGKVVKDDLRALVPER